MKEKTKERWWMAGIGAVCYWAVSLVDASPAGWVRTSVFLLLMAVAVLGAWVLRPLRR